MKVFRSQRRALLRCAAALSLFVLAPAAQGAAWTLDELMTELARTQATEVRFTETKQLAALRVPLELHGTLLYRRPDHLERHVQAPFEEHFVADGDRVTLERPLTGERHQLSLQSQPVLWAFIESIRATLRGDAAALQRFYRLLLHGERAQWTLTLLPSDPDMAKLVRVIRIGGREGQVRSIEVQETSGDRTVTRIHPSQ